MLCSQTVSLWFFLSGCLLHRMANPAIYNNQVLMRKDPAKLIVISVDEALTDASFDVVWMMQMACFWNSLMKQECRSDCQKIFKLKTNARGCPVGQFSFATHVMHAMEGNRKGFFQIHPGLLALIGLHINKFQHNILSNLEMKIQCHLMNKQNNKVFPHWLLKLLA